MSLNAGMFSSNTDMWATPKDFYDELNEEFNFDNNFKRQKRLTCYQQMNRCSATNTD